MRRGNPALNWDRLLDGGTYKLDLDEIGWNTSLNDLRAKVHYEADRRRAIAHTHKINASTLEIRGEGFTPRNSGPCSCGAKVWDRHVITCSILGENAATMIGGPNAGIWRPQPAPTRPTLVSQPAPQEPAASTQEPDLTEAEIEALLGPCTCGQEPICLPSCARA